MRMTFAAWAWPAAGSEQREEREDDADDGDSVPVHHDAPLV
jgi:hypothetical protein